MGPVVSLFQEIDALLVNVESIGLPPGFAKRCCEGQADVTKTDDAEDGGLRHVESVLEGRNGRKGRKVKVNRDIPAFSALSSFSAFFSLLLSP